MSSLGHKLNMARSRIRGEAQAWWQATLRAVPGETGCWLRRKLMGFDTGPRSRVLQGVVIYRPEKLTLGARVGISVNGQIHAGGGVTIGDDVLIGPRVLIWSQNHNFDQWDVPIARQGYDRKPITIGAGTWIAGGAIILPGVTLGENCVVGAGAVVTRSFPAGSIIAGVPAKAIGQRPGAEVAATSAA